jgi:hypothetical protein
MKTHLALALIVAAPHCLADDTQPSLSVSAFATTHQVEHGSTSQLQFGVEALYPTPYGAAYWQDGEGGWVVPAPAGWVSLGVANEPMWSLGSNATQNLGVARYGFDLPRQGTLSVGYATRLGPSNPGAMLIANMDAPIALVGDNKISLWGWASLADGRRRQSLAHEDDGSHWQLEQANLLLIFTHPLQPHWDLHAGIGSRWVANDNGGHTAGWQTLLGLSWNWGATGQD